MNHAWVLSTLCCITTSRGQSIAKYNRFLEIERALGNQARYAGAAIYGRWQASVKA